MSRRSLAVRLTVALVAACLLAPAAASADCVTGQNAQCGGADLHGRDLRNVNLTGANFQNANLSGARLDQAVLTRANLIGANLKRANLSGANLDHAVLHRADLNGSNLQGATASHADLSFVLMEDVNAQGVNFSHATLDGSQLVRSIFIEAHIAHAHVHGVNFNEADFRKSVVNDTDFEGSSLFNARFDDADISNAKFTNVRFANTSMNRMRQNYLRPGGTQLYPSTLNEDNTAKNGLFVHISTLLNAYDDYGYCFRQSFDDEGACESTGESGHTYGFTGHVGWYWSSKHRHVVFKGQHGVMLVGSMGYNWEKYRVDEVHGLTGASPTGTFLGEHAKLGQPGGDIHVNLETRYYNGGGFFKAAQYTGYIMRLSGYLPRKSA